MLCIKCKKEIPDDSPFAIGAEKNKQSKKGNHAVEQIHKALYTKFPEIAENHTPLFCRGNQYRCAYP